MSSINAVFRPAARHILTIGKGLIKDNYTALSELVKNAYDAEATEVSVIFSKIEIDEEKKLKITVKDNGHGMSTNDVLTKWLVPSTDNKNKEKDQLSKNGKRKLVGSKGIGRYAVSFLGDSILMQTVGENIDENGEVQIEKTEIYIEWKEFEKKQYTYLDEVPILVESEKSNNLNLGTTLDIIAERFWTVAEHENLIDQLRRLVLAYEVDKSSKTGEASNSDTFTIKLTDLEGEKSIDPYPIFDEFHYRIYGTISPKIEVLPNGSEQVSSSIALLKAKFENKYLRDVTLPIIDKQIEFNLDNIANSRRTKVDMSNCGIVDFDLRVIDQEKDDAKKTNKRDISDIRELWQKLAGVSLFRNGFRILPYGNPDVDWLGLDMRRVNVSDGLSNNRLIGTVKIQNETDSKLEEKSSREGLKENAAYEGLREYIKQALLIIEIERRAFRKKLKDDERLQTNMSQALPNVADLSNLGTSLTEKLEKAGVDKQVIKAVNQEISQVQKEKEKVVVNVQKYLTEQIEEQKVVIAVFANQASLGKVIIQIFHETTNNLHSIRNRLPNLAQWNKNIQERLDKLVLVQDEYLSNIFSKIMNNIKLMESSADSISRYYNKLKPLTVTRRRPKKTINLKKTIDDTVHIFDSTLEESRINVSLTIPYDLKITIWEDDFVAILVNLIDNSIFWVNEADKPEKRIEIKVSEDIEEIAIDIIDNGSGLSETDIVKGQIFDLGVSKKTDGTGVGLYVAGESAKRNNGELKAIHSSSGAHFQVTFKKK